MKVWPKISAAILVGVVHLGASLVVLFNELDCSGVAHCHSWLTTTADHVLTVPMAQIKDFYLYYMNDLDPHSVVIFIPIHIGILLMILNSIVWAVAAFVLLSLLSRRTINRSSP